MIGVMLALALQAPAAENSAAEPPLTLADIGFHASSQLGGFYPDRAMRVGRTGDVQARCTIAGKGVLTNCTVLNVTPSNSPEFGMSALKLLARHDVDAVTRDGRPTAGRDLLITLEYRIRRGAPDITVR